MNVQEFLKNSYTAYHATQNVCNILTSNGFVELSLGEKWDIAEGGKYFVTRNGSSVIAFVVGANKVLSICESHTDSPSFKVKGTKLVASEGAKRLNTEKYGGGLLYTYFDRPLKIAGRVLEKCENGVVQKLVASDYNVVIPSLCVHFNPAVNDGFSVNPQVDTLPLLAQSDVELYKTLTDGEVLDADLYVVPATEPFLAGANGEFLCAPRIDNLTSVYTSIQALLHCNPQTIAMAVCLDNEEVGSGTRQGNPRFVSQVVDALCDALGMDVVARQNAIEGGMVLSVDNGHACHPAHPEKSDALYRAYLNKGIVIKHHTNYATDGLSSAIFKNILQKADVAFQDLYNRSDVRCGSTVGLATARELGIKTCDIGMPQLAMHSACETCGSTDVDTMQQALTAFLNASPADLIAK